ncbi:glycosyltransferase family 2 protein [Paenibacillus sacheonensis]|uniref:Glycosyltransferase n=1 Tax=Paenibacillus sacheonensis TaxID=742054 RepID=A0A7X5C1V3_9BACL|nr:glycosyltransferase family 2 protein [Paenibacillus sacheonensis]MBM7566474.1 glycosyltransferase involved in cell wall biosynthesis [Paenibacillus sacheonensis]NBC73157.1 glycosyltransferase [Paenibacillus sacheonensis]
MNSSIALVMIVRNEEATLARCLESAVQHVEEIIIVDTGSTDKTKQIAERFGARIFDYAWGDDFAAARNYALDQSTSTWNLVLDADEYITAMDRTILIQTLSEQACLGRITIVSLTSEQGEQNEARGYITRLLPAGVRFEGRIHEQAKSDLPRMNVPITVLHDGYLCRSKSERNIPLLLAELKNNPNNSYIYFQLGREYQGLQELQQASEYFEKALNLLNGEERYAPNVAVHYIYALKEIKRYTEALKLIQKNYGWLATFPDYHFACGIFYLDLVMSDPGQYMTFLPEIEASYKRSIAIGESDRYDTVSGTGSYLALYNLAMYYETFGRMGEAVHCLKRATNLGYEKAKIRLTNLGYEKAKIRLTNLGV